MSGAGDDVDGEDVVRVAAPVLAGLLWRLVVRGLPCRAAIWAS